MKFIVDSKKFHDAVNDIQGKGKYLSNSGLSSQSLNVLCFMALSGNTLELWNADSSLSLNINMEVEGEIDGEAVVDAKTLLSFLKKMPDNIEIQCGDVFAINNGNQTLTLPRIRGHSDLVSINRLRGMLEHISYEETPSELFLFGRGQFEGAFTLDADLFKKTMGLCELIRSGIYRLDYTGETVEISTQQDRSSSYNETLPVSNGVGEAATVEWSGPIHSFFDGPINFYVKDDFPLLLIGEDRKLIKSPHMG